MRRDPSDIERLFADEFCDVNSAGVEMSKADLIREMSSTDYVIESFQNEDIRARVIGDCAVVTAVCGTGSASVCSDCGAERHATRNSK